MTNDHVLSFFKCENRLERTDLKLNMRFYNPLVVAIETGKNLERLHNWIVFRFFLVGFQFIGTSDVSSLMIILEKSFLLLDSKEFRNHKKLKAYLNAFWF